LTSVAHGVQACVERLFKVHYHTMIDLINEILQTLKHNKMRTALTGIAVAWGIFMLIVLLGVGNGVTNSFKKNAMTPGSQKINVWGGRTSKPYHGYREGRRIDLKQNDMTVIADENAKFVDEVTSTIDGYNGNISSGKESVSGWYAGVFPSELELRSEMRMKYGRFLNEKDMVNNAKSVVISEYTAKRLFPPEGDDAVGKRLSFNGLSFLVVGVYESRWGRNIYIPYNTAKMLAGNKDELGSMSVMLKNVNTIEDGDAAETAIRQTLASTHDFAPDDARAVWTWNQFSQGLKGLQAMNILNLSIWILGLLTLLTGVVGISNIMFVSVKERTHEIGIRRAIGAKPRSILVQIIAESVAITTLFGYIGIVFGTAATYVLNIMFGDTDFMDNPSVNISIAIEVTAVLIVAGALAGLFPALKSLKIKPVEALRDE